MTQITPHIYLITLGISAQHGSELSVGWQWYKRISQRAPVTVVTHTLFDDSRFVDAETRRTFVFLGRKPFLEGAFNRIHQYYAFTFWFMCRRYLKARLTDQDRVFIVTPAALWFLPVLGGLAGFRGQVFFGPIGGDLLASELLMSARERLRAKLRNVLTRGLLAAWRKQASRLPAHVGFRAASTERMFPVEGFTSAGLFPEVDLGEALQITPDDSASRPPAHPSETTTNLVFIDARLRKNTPRNLTVAAALATERKTLGNASIRTILLGSRRNYTRYKAACTAIEGAEWKETLPRAEFLDLLSKERPNVVALSLSEGVPGFLLEALAAGCWVLAYPVGGIEWLIESAAEIIPAPVIAGTELPGSGVWLRWNQHSALHYQSDLQSRLSSLLEDFIP